VTPDDDARRVRPDGLSVRRLRHERGWSPRDLVVAIERASIVATGVPQTITPNLLSGIEEHNEPISFATLRLVASGFDCDVVDLLLEER
jgi:transcriptional regulator with XRE-family HTH domain